MGKESDKQDRCHNVQKLKEKYNPLKKRYSLPEFEFLNENFEIERIEPESEILLKVIRKHIAEKIFFVLRSLELFINPQNAPVFIFKIIKLMNEEEKEAVRLLYDKVSGFEIESFGLEADYDEKKEAEFIKSFSKEWKVISEGLKKLYKSMRDNHQKDLKKQSRSYYG